MAPCTAIFSSVLVCHSGHMSETHADAKAGEGDYGEAVLLRAAAARRSIAYNYSAAHAGKRDVIRAGAIRGVTDG